MFSVIVIPITFLGATYYPWARLTPIPWLKWAVLVNPLVYMSEGFRMALTPVAHMPGPAVYAALVGFVVGLGWLGIDGFRRRVLA
jgi:ABC-2 type transport system permease protein